MTMLSFRVDHRFAGALAGPSGAEDLLATAVLGAISSPRRRVIENKRADLYRVVLSEGSKARLATDRLVNP
jgi:hypothetical protein